MKLKIGMKVRRRPVTFAQYDESNNRMESVEMTGKVCYIHPKGRFHTVEFSSRGGAIRESFTGDTEWKNAIKCSACHNNDAWGETEKTNYCPNCGAKMDLEEDDG